MRPLSNNNLYYLNSAILIIIFQVVIPFTLILIIRNVFISCNSAQKINPNYDSIVDTYDFKGPLNGIMSAFKAHPDKSWLVVAVDLPFVSQDILTTLLSHRDSNYLATCFFNSDYNFPEPLLSIWEPSSFAMLRTYCEGGGRSPREFLTKHRTKLIDLTDRLILRGFNTKEELEELKGKEKTKAKS